MTYEWEQELKKRIQGAIIDINMAIIASAPDDVFDIEVVGVAVVTDEGEAAFLTNDEHGYDSGKTNIWHADVMQDVLGDVTKIYESTVKNMSS